jgi:hypothetical protein
MLPVAQRHPIGVIAIACTVLAALGGCGSDGEVTAFGLSDEAIARADFIQAANAACTERREEMTDKGQRIYANASEKSRDAGARELIEEVVAPGFEREVRELGDLTPPPGEEDEVNELISAIEQMVDRMREDLAAGRGYPYRKTEKLAATYGLPDCGRP